MNMPGCAILNYRSILAAIIFAGIGAVGHAQVNQGELEQNLPPVTFMNYEGPHARIDTREQIRQIGANLGQAISNSQERSGSTSRYFVIHSVSAQESNRLDADIFGLGVDAGVDHIRNLRTIIQGYLQTAYGYSARDASLLAEYITVYNAVYRGDWEYFTERYKTQVVQHLGRERTGLSIRFDEWPGRTQILIPLGHGGLSSIDTSVISDRRVVEEMRKEDDRGVEQRRDMVDLKEREAAQAEQRAQVEREAIREEERKIAQERQDAAQENQAAGRSTQEELDKRDQELEQRRSDAQKLEDFADRKTQEAQRDRQDIAQDQQAAIIEDASGAVFGVMIEKQNSTMGRLVRFNSAGRELRRSPLDTIHVRTVTFISGKILAIAGENKGNGAVRLIDINQTNLEMAKQGDDDLLPGSLLWVNENDIYAITVNLGDNSCYLGRFDTNLALRAKSKIKTHPNSSLTIQQGRLLTQREDGSVLILNPTDLTEVSR